MALGEQLVVPRELDEGVVPVEENGRSSLVYASRVMRRILWSLLVLAPAALLARFVFDLDETTLFVLSALALIPLAWVIGEATEHAAEHTGPGVGGFLNATFGNAPS